MTKEYCNLHAHSTSSLLDGMAKFDEYADRAKELGMKGICFTEHGNLHGLLDGYEAAEKAGLKYHPGIEFYQARKTRFDRDTEEQAGKESAEWAQRGPYHLGVIAYNNEGYHNLIKLSSRAFLEGFYVKPRVDHDLLSQHSGGLVALSGCLSGEVQQALLRDDFDFALNAAAKMRDIVGKDNYFIEVQNHGIEEETRNYPKLIEIAKKIDVPIVATCDSHYTCKEHHSAHDILLCQPIGTVITCTRKNGSTTGYEYYEKNIEDIVEGDRVVSWNSTNRRGSILKSGNKVESIGRRVYNGKLISISLPDGTTSSYTHDHICIARMDAPSLVGKFIVYLMKKNNKFRVGSTSYKRKNGNLLGISKRSKENGADATWILSIHDSEAEARTQEEFVSLIFQIPKWTFKASIDRPDYCRPLWDFIVDNSEQANKCLTHFGRDIKYPLWSKQSTLSQRSPIEIRACNLIDGLLVCQLSSITDKEGSTTAKKNPMTNDGSGAWKPISVSSQTYNNIVYSIEVQNNHTYVADDIITHNCVNTGSRIDTPNRFKFSGPHFYLKSYDEMAQLFPEEYLKNTLLVLEKHEVKLEFNDHHIPNFPVPNNQTVDEYFVSWVYRGAEERFGSNWRSKNEVVERLDYEVGVIKEMEFPNYFLIVADIVEWARQNNIMAGPGRGSAAGSLVSYCMKITEVNPLKYGLPFERFLIPGRKSLPDIDLDFDDRYREAVIQYTRNKYGFDHTAQIGTVSEIGAKTAIKDVARVLNYPYSVGDEINKAMPPALFGKTKTLDECLQSDEFLRLYETDEVAKEIIDIAKIFEGQWRQTGVHPAGLVIADKPLTEYIPLLQKGEGNPIITQWDMKRVDKLGLLKIDFLGLRNISMEVMAMENIKKTRGIEFKDPYLLIDEEDKQLYEALGNGDNVGVFQLESNGLLNLMVGMKPSSLEDIAALLALYRPGPMGSNFHNEYVERKHGRKPVKYLHPTLKPYLEGTYGLLIYQEQVLSIARFIAGFSVPDSDGLRKAMGKKIPAEMKKWHVQFVEGCINTSNMPRAIAEQLFTEIEHHADYSFSKNHAVAYAFTSYLTAYFKSKYPTEFLAAAMSSLGSETTNKQRLRLYLNECRKKGIIVAPPSIQKRNALFEVVKEDEIRYGFQSVKGFGEKGIELLGKDEKEYVNLFQFLREADNNYLDRGTVSSLIDAGCLDGFFSQLPIKRESLSRKQKIDTLYRESNTLGVFLSDHPFNNVQDLVAGRTTHNLLQLNDMSAQEKVKVAGIVVDVEKKITRAGKKMFNLLIEDSDSAIDVVVMPQIAAKMEEEPFAIGDVLIITGKTKREGDDENATVGLILFEVEKIDDSVLIGGSPILISTNNKLSLLQIQRMNDIIEKNKGNSPVFLSFRDGNLEVKMRFNALTTKEVESTLKILAEV